MVLVKNENVLPFEKEGQDKTILVLGRLADMENTGDHASSDATPSYVVTPYQGIVNYQKETGNQVELYSGEDLKIAREKASKADQVILVVGYTFEDEGEYMITEGAMKKSAEAGKLIGDPGIGGDRESLNLLSKDEELIQAVAGANKNTVVVYVGGSAIDMGSWQDDVPAILFAWYNGMEGGNALARILYGEVNPSGKLPFSIARNAGDYPFFNPYTMTIEYGYYHGYTLFDKKEIEVAYPFGHGLSYTTFEYDSLEIDAVDPEKQSLKVRARVSNTGQMAGEEVVQLYVGFSNSEIDRPVKLLKGFDKIAIEPGESRAVEFQIDLEELAWYDPESKSWKIEEMDYAIFVGPSSDEDNLLKSGFSIE
jgi:beta-glucosidase